MHRRTLSGRHNHNLSGSKRGSNPYETCQTHWRGWTTVARYVIEPSIGWKRSHNEARLPGLAGMDHRHGRGVHAKKEHMHDEQLSSTRPRMSGESRVFFPGSDLVGFPKNSAESLMNHTAQVPHFRGPSFCTHTRIHTQTHAHTVHTQYTNTYPHTHIHTHTHRTLTHPHGHTHKHNKQSEPDKRTCTCIHALTQLQIEICKQPYARVQVCV